MLKIHPMKKSLFVLLIITSLNISCTMDGADNPGNSAESPEGTGPANPPSQTDVTEQMHAPVINVDTTTTDTAR